MSIVFTILMFCLIIIIHELGHFTAARIFKMNVREFSIGMGPTILKKRGRKTVYSLKLLPIGGSVQLGEDMESTDPNDFRNKPVWQRMIVIVAGAVMNLILGLIVCLISVLVSGNVVTTTIRGFRDSATTSGILQQDDRIVSINGLSVWTSMDISYQLQNSVPEKSEDGAFAYYSFGVERDGERLQYDKVPFTVRYSDDGTSSVYFDFYVYSEPLTIGRAISETFGSFMTESRLIIISLVNLLKGSYGLNELSGPIGVVSAMNTAVSSPEYGLENFLLIFSLITINVGIFNLLPVPALDGCRFLILLIEAIRRKPMKPEREAIIHFAGFALLMLLMLVVTFNDIWRLVTGG